MGEALVKLYFLAAIYSLMVIVVAVYTLAWVLGPAFKHVARKLAEGYFSVLEERAWRAGLQTLRPQVATRPVQSPDTSPPEAPSKPNGTGGKPQDAGHRWLGE